MGVMLDPVLAVFFYLLENKIQLHKSKNLPPKTKIILILLKRDARNIPPKNPASIISVNRSYFSKACFLTCIVYFEIGDRALEI